MILDRVLNTVDHLRGGAADDDRARHSIRLGAQHLVGIEIRLISDTFLDDIGFRIGGPACNRACDMCAVDQSLQIRS